MINSNIISQRKKTLFIITVDDTQNQDQFSTENLEANHSKTIQQIEQRITDREISIDPSVPDKLILDGEI